MIFKVLPEPLGAVPGNGGPWRVAFALFILLLHISN